MRAWLVRSGKSGENDAFCIDSSYCIINWSEAGDLTQYSTREKMLEHVASLYPGGKSRMISHYSGQLFAFSHRIEIGDLVCLPLKSSGQVAIGKVTGAYEYDSEASPQQRQRRKVEWLRTDVSRAAIKQDLLYTLGAYMTVCEISRNDGAQRILEIGMNGIDPGSKTAQGVLAETPSDADEAPVVDLVETSADQLRQYIIEEFAGHALSDLVASVLTAEGFVCEVAPPGPDGGIDIFAGRGPLGLDAPRLLVQVKSQTSQVDAKTVRELHGVISTHGADQGLLVAWGGINKIAAIELTTQRFNVRVWDADDLIESIIRNYNQLSTAMKSRIPLRQVWMLDTSDRSVEQF
jgi:restriction system protein